MTEIETTMLTYMMVPMPLFSSPGRAAGRGYAFALCTLGVAP